MDEMKRQRSVTGCLALMFAAGLLGGCDGTKESTPPPTEATEEESSTETAAVKERPAFAIRFLCTRKDDGQQMGGWVWATPDDRDPQRARNRVEPPDDESLSFKIPGKVKYLLKPTFVKHEDGSDHWKLAVAATTPTEGGGEETSEQTVQAAFDGSTPLPVFEDEHTTMELRLYQ
jgi:hypothetical protein